MIVGTGTDDPRQVAPEDANAMMDAKRLEERRTALSDLARALSRRLAQVERDFVDRRRSARPSRVPMRLGDADEEGAEALAEELRHLGTEREQVEEALRRIQDGTYGLCARCGEDIAAGRLEAKPEALLCIECAQESEWREQGSST